MALLDLFPVLDFDFKNLFAVFSLTFNENALAFGFLVQTQRHCITAIRAFYFSNLPPPKNV